MYAHRQFSANTQKNTGRFFETRLEDEEDVASSTDSEDEAKGKPQHSEQLLKKARRDDEEDRMPLTFDPEKKVVNSHFLPCEKPMRLATFQKKLHNLFGAFFKPDVIAIYTGTDKDSLGRAIRDPHATNAPIFSGSHYQDFLEIVDDLNPPKNTELQNLGDAVAHIRLHDEDEGCGAGTMIDEEHMITAKHVIHPEGGAEHDPDDITLHFNYQIQPGDSFNGTFNEFCDTHSAYDKDANTYQVEEIVEKGSTDALDYAILKIKKESSKKMPSFYSHLSTDIPDIFSSSFPTQSLISVVHHPEAKPKKVSLGVVKSSTSTLFHHSAHTEGGSSGAPIYISNTATSIVGIHTAGDNANKVNAGLTIETISNESAIVRRLLP